MNVSHTYVWFVCWMLAVDFRMSLQIELLSRIVSDHHFFLLSVGRSLKNAKSSVNSSQE